jgi:hypothetical protein
MGFGEKMNLHADHKHPRSVAYLPTLATHPRNDAAPVSVGNDKTVEDPRMVFLIPDAPKGAASTVSRKKPSTRAQIYEAAAMAAFVVLMLLFVVEVAPALVG